MLETIELKRAHKHTHAAFNVIGFFVELQIRIKWNTHTFWINYLAHWLGFTKFSIKKYTNSRITCSMCLCMCIFCWYVYVCVYHLRFYVFRTLILLFFSFVCFQKCHGYFLQHHLYPLIRFFIFFPSMEEPGPCYSF